MAIIIKGDVHGDVISDGGVKNETHYHYGHKTNNTLNAVSKTQHVSNIVLTPERQSLLDQLQNYAEKGDWVNGITSEQIKAMLKAVLGIDENLSVKNAELSEVLWQLLESGRGDRVKIVWQNMVGYLDDKKLFRLKGSPALNKDFFGNDNGYTNIDKGRPSKGLMTADFESIIQLLDAYCPEK
jgi:hypothetical protein